MSCKLCGRDRRLIKAHIVPEAFFRIGREQDGESHVLATSDPRIPPKRAPIGVYDRQLVCEECERRFQIWDNYAAELLIRDLDKSFQPVKDESGTVAFVAEEFDYDRLKLFAISVLWRAAASTHSYFQGVDIGPFADQAAQAILQRISGDEHFFSVLFSRWVAPDRLKPLEAAHMSPFRERWNGVNSVRLYLGPVVAYIKVDQRRFDQNFVPLILKAGRPLHLIARDIHGSKDLKAMARVARNFCKWRGER